MRYLFLVLALPLLLSSCNLGLMRHRLDPALDRFAHEYLNTLRSAKLFDCQRMSGEQLASEGSRPILSAYYNFLSTIKMDSLELISSSDSTIVHKKGEVVNIRKLLYEARTNQGFLLYEVGLSTYDNGIFAETIRITSSSISLKNTNAFHWSGKPFLFYAFLALMALVFLFVLFTAAAILRSDLGNKWLWMLGNWLGLFGLSLNWTTGEWGFQAFFVQLASVGFHTELPYGAVSLVISLPVFSLWFWIAKRKAEFDREVMQ